ncbi:MAG: gliding motility protein GldC [bacterium]|nr:gliding motility protein GldC [bacterium]
MKKSKIWIEVELDENNIPEKIQWDADEKGDEGLTETKSMSLALWDADQKNTMRIDLWSKDMPVDEMKRFYIDCIGGIAQSALNSTGDEYINAELNAVCDKLIKHLQDELNQ